MELTDDLSLRFASLAIFIVSLAVGFVLLGLRDLVFEQDVRIGDGRHAIDFNKKIEEEEQLNLDEIDTTRRAM